MSTLNDVKREKERKVQLLGVLSYRFSSNPLLSMHALYMDPIYYIQRRRWIFPWNLKVTHKELVKSFANWSNAALSETYTEMMAGSIRINLPNSSMVCVCTVISLYCCHCIPLTQTTPRLRCGNSRELLRAIHHTNNTCSPSAEVESDVSVKVNEPSSHENLI